MCSPVPRHDEGIVLREDVAVPTVREHKPVGLVQLAVRPCLVEVVSDALAGPPGPQAVAAPECPPLQGAEPVHRDPVPQVADNRALTGDADRSLVVVVPALRVCVPHAAVESLGLSGGGHSVAAVLVVVEESSRGGDTYRAQAALPVAPLAGVEGENHEDRGPAGLVRVLSPPRPGVVMVGVGGNTIGHHQSPLLPPHTDDLLVVQRGQTLVTLALQYH